MKLSKRAKLDLTKLFPKHVFAGFEKPMQWNLKEYEQLHIDAKIFVLQGQCRVKIWAVPNGYSVFLDVPKDFQEYPDLPLTRSTDLNFVSARLNDQKLIQYSERIKKFVREITLKAEQQKLKNILDELFPPHIAAGWDYRNTVKHKWGDSLYFQNDEPRAEFSIFYYPDRNEFAFYWHEGDFQDMIKLQNQNISPNEMKDLLPKLHDFIKQIGDQENENT